MSQVEELNQKFIGGVIMDVVTPEQAKIAEDAGASAVMALERVPADIRAQGGVARMSDPDLIEGIIDTVGIPVMAKARIGHTVEAKILEHLGVDYIDESEVLSPADYVNHIDKRVFSVPFVCGATNLGEALRRINEGASMIRSKGEAGTGDVSEATKHIRKITSEIAALQAFWANNRDELYVAAKELQAPYELVAQVAENGELPVPLLVAGIVTLEICVLIGLPLNFANIVALPLLLGVGVAFKIYYVTAWRQGRTNLLQSSLTRAIFFSALTTATAFGSLWLSSHPGTASMGKLLALSLVTTLAAVLLFQPALMGKPREALKEEDIANDVT